MTAQRPSASLRPLKLHELLAMQTVWTEDLWDATLRYLDGRIGTTHAVWMTLIILDRDQLPESNYKIDYLRQFRAFPPSMLLAAFDIVRQGSTD